MSITADDIQKIRELAAEGVSECGIERETGVSRNWQERGRCALPGKQPLIRKAETGVTDEMVKKVIEHMRGNMTADEWESYCADLTAATVTFLIVAVIYAFSEGWLVWNL
jgi:hypothetical protein